MPGYGCFAFGVAIDKAGAIITISMLGSVPQSSASNGREGVEVSEFSAKLKVKALPMGQLVGSRV